MYLSLVLKITEKISSEIMEKPRTDGTIFLKFSQESFRIRNGTAGAINKIKPVISLFFENENPFSDGKNMNIKMHIRKSDVSQRKAPVCLIRFIPRKNPLT